MGKFEVSRLVLSIAVLGCTTEHQPQALPQDPEAADRFKRVDMAPLAHSSFVPRSLGPTIETFIVELAGDPVAIVQSKATAKLTVNERGAARNQLALQQAVVEPQLLALGGRVTGRYYHAYNGMRVRISTTQAAALKNIPGVVGVHRPQLFKPTNVNGVPRIGAPVAWTSFAGVDGFRGEGIKVAIIDSGIDYTHLTFGGPGTPEAYEAAFAAGTQPADPALFGPDAPKMKGGVDLAGDAYNASDPANSVPQPDENPLDCGGHGTHVAGSAAGFGVRADGTLYDGPYDETTFNSTFLVGPGAAPMADLYAVRVFGCDGSTALVVDALDWAVENDMDVVNMSLGSDFGAANNPSAVAATNAAKAGIVVVASAGNDGPVDYITGSPASSAGTISVAAQDPTSSFPGVSLAAASGAAVQTMNANGAPMPGGSLQAVILLDAAGNVSLGCDPAEYVDVVGKLVVTKRGSCARVARAIFGEQAGAAAVLMINNVDGFPPLTGPITQNPDDGTTFVVTIPFLGASLADEAALRALDGQSLTGAPTVIANPRFNQLAGFTSLGPTLEGRLKPDVTAPGVSIRSAGIGSGNQPATLSGTSMAAPHTAGLAALARQAHPGWSPAQIKAAIINTASPADVVEYPTRRAGSGLVNAAGAVRTSVVAFADPTEVHLNLGFIEQKADYLQVKPFRVRNRGAQSVSFDLTTEFAQGSPHSVQLNPSSITVPAGQTFTVNATVTIDAATAGDTTAFREVAGLVLLTPTGGTNHGVSLRLPYYGILRPQASLNAVIQPRLSPIWTNAFARVTNVGSEIAATADFYAHGLNDAADEGQGYVDLRAVGAQSFESDTGRRIVLAIHTSRPWQTPSLTEFDVSIDTNLDGTADFLVIGIDRGQLEEEPFFSGQIATAVRNLATGVTDVQTLAFAPTNGSTMLLAFDSSQIGLTADSPRFSYSVRSFDLASANEDATDGSAIFNPFSSSVSTGAVVTVEPNQVAFVPVSLDPDEQAESPALGHMVVAVDNRGGTAEAKLLPLR